MANASAGHRLTFTEVRELLHLFNACRDRGEGPILWRQHLCAALGLFLNAHYVMSAELARSSTDKWCVRGCTGWDSNASAGSDHRQLEQRSQYALEMETGWASLATAAAEASRCDSTARSDRVKVALPADKLATGLHSVMQVPRLPCTVDALALYRQSGTAEYTRRDVSVLQLVHQQMVLLIGEQLSAWHEPAPSLLPPRARQVLRLVLSGHSDKQIAAELAVSPHTVNQYTKKVYRHFRVNSRAELLAYWVSRGWRVKDDWRVPDGAPIIHTPVEEAIASADHPVA